MVNQATIMGRVGKIETKTTASGVKITNISIVTTKKYIKDGEKHEKATWHNATAFQKVAEIAEKYVAIGDMLYIQGEMQNDKYTTKEGQERVKNFILIQTIELLPKNKEHASAAKPQDKSYEEAFGTVTDGDIPW